MLQRPELHLTMVVPYHNPGDRLRPTVDGLVATLEASGATFEVITVDDGSTDGSGDTLTGAPPSVVRLQQPHNAGKGEALRAGFARGRGRYLGFIDADGDLPPEQVAAFVETALRDQPDMVLGTKRDPRSAVVSSPIRRLSSWAWQLAVRVLFHLTVRDTQTGLKLVRRDVMAQVLPLTRERRFAFDLELLVVARKLGYTNLEEVPVQISTRHQSTISAKAAATMLFDLVSIFGRLHLTRYYDRRAAAPYADLVPAADAATGR